MSGLGFFGGGSDSSDSETEEAPVVAKQSVTEESKPRSKSALPAPEEVLLIRQKSSFFNEENELAGVNWNNESLLRAAPRPPTPDPAEAWKSWKSQLAPENASKEDEAYFQEGQTASSMKGKMKRPEHVTDMALGWSKQYGDGAQANYQTTTRESEQINPADEAKIKLPKKRDAEKNEKKLPEGAKGPKLTKKQVTRETNARNAAQFGNLTDY